MCLLSTWGFPARVRISQATFFFFFFTLFSFPIPKGALSLSLSLNTRLTFYYFGLLFLSLSSSFFTLLSLSSYLIIKVKTFNQVSTNFNQRLDLSLSITASCCFSLYSRIYIFYFHYIIIESHTPFKSQKSNKLESLMFIWFMLSQMLLYVRIRFSVKSPFGLGINFD